MTKLFLPLVLAALLTPSAPAVERVPPKVLPAVPDAAEMLSPADVRLSGWLGERIDANAKHRLPNVDTVPLLAGYHKKPGSHPWIGEHIGKWLHAATLAWAKSGDPVLRKKLDLAAAELVTCQEPNGYLGTYIPAQRFGLYPGADWDVWSHKYNLIGLLTYYEYTGDKAALDACRKMGDLMVATFPAKRSILAAGTHVGMAATSVLEPVVLLYRFTGDKRYLDFARYIVKSWDEPGGPKILATLLTVKRVDKTANGKAYEMLSNLVGLCELYRATGEQQYLQAVLNAWQDIVAHRLYITGSMSSHEHFHGDHELPNGMNANICETCVTVTWLQLNLQLLRLTGEAKYGDELERTLYNHLPAAQHPAGDDWAYYTALEGKKPYDKGITCCHSSGPRGMALAPQTAYFRGRDKEGDVLIVSTLESSRGTLALGGQSVATEQVNSFPSRGSGHLVFQMKGSAAFSIRVRVPEWAGPTRAFSTPGRSRAVARKPGWIEFPRQNWRAGESLIIEYCLDGKLVMGKHGDAGRAVWTWGPFVLAYDEHGNLKLPPSRTLGLIDTDLFRVRGPLCTSWPGEDARYSAWVEGRNGKGMSARLTTFADAGASGGQYRVWLRAPGTAAQGGDSLLLDGQESRSRPGNLEGSIIDGDRATCVVTFDGRPAAEDFYAVKLAKPVKIGRVVFAHGKTFHDGGWFDASRGKPRVQVQRKPGGEWETIGELADYPATTATDPGGLKPGQASTLRLAAPVEAAAVRVVGVPAYGDNPQQAFSSCGELEAFEK